MSDDALLQAYRSAEYHLRLPDAAVVLRIGEHSQRMRKMLNDLEASFAYIVTAHNPQSRLLSPDENARRHQQLVETVDAIGAPWFDAVNKDPRKRWPDELGVVVAAIDRARIVAIAQRFDQRAFVEIPALGPVSLIT